jgi:hypothetical protein
VPKRLPRLLLKKPPPKPQNPKGYKMIIINNNISNLSMPPKKGTKKPVASAESKGKYSL